MLSASESAQCGKSKLRLGNGERRSLELQPSMPANRCPIELVRPHVGEEFEVVDEDEQRRASHLAEREFGLEEVARCECAGEACVGGPLACHVPRGRLQRANADSRTLGQGCGPGPAERAASLLEGQPSVGT